MSAWFRGRWRACFEPRVKDSRLRRGFRYYKDGAVGRLVVDKGEIRSEVHGSRPRPYLVTIKAQPFSDSQWTEIGRVLAQNPELFCQVTEGLVTQSLEEELASHGLSLFPDWCSNQTHPVCTCPDEECPCKHAAATFYAAMDIIDEDPSLLLRLRGKDQSELLALASGLVRDDAASVLETEPHGERPAGVYEEYWGRGDESDLPQVPAGSERGSIVLPPMPFPDREDLIQKTLQEAYRLASELAQTFAAQMDPTR